MAIIVVAIHTHPLENCKIEWINSIYSSLITLAVPFFFISKGFLLAKKINSGGNNREVLKSSIIKYIKLYLIWSLVYFPLALIPYFTNDYSIFKSVALYIRGFVFLGENFNSWILWYILSVIYSLSIIYLVQRNKPSNKKLFIIFISAIITSFLIDFIVNNSDLSLTIITIIRKFIILTINNGRLLQGTYFISFGMILASIQFKSYVNYIICPLGFIIMALFNNYFLSKIGCIICTIGLFNIVVSINLKDKKIYSYFKRYSTIIYFIHLYVWTIYYYIVYNKITYGIDSFIITFIISLIISVIYVYAKEKKKSVTQQ